MPYRIAGIDVHKKKLAVVVADVEIEDEYAFERRWYGGNPEQLQLLAEWLIEQQVEEVVMESTAPYWKPLWETLERYWKPICEKRERASRMSGTLHLAQALSNRGRRGRKRDFRDAERLVKRLPELRGLRFGCFAFCSQSAAFFLRACNKTRAATALERRLPRLLLNPLAVSQKKW
jgi:hypothetical protein